MVGAALLAPALAACSVAGDTPVPSPTAIVIRDTPVPQSVTLHVVLHGRPTRTFLVYGGRWRVCDHGTVANPGSVVAHDVRVVVDYVDKGADVGHATAADAASDGGALGDIAAAGSADFTVCGIATNEPDSDLVRAVVGA